MDSVQPLQYRNVPSLVDVGIIIRKMIENSAGFIDSVKNSLSTNNTLKIQEQIVDLIDKKCKWLHNAKEYAEFSSLFDNRFEKGKELISSKLFEAAKKVAFTNSVDVKNIDAIHIARTTTNNGKINYSFNFGNARFTESISLSNSDNAIAGLTIKLRPTRQ